MKLIAYLALMGLIKADQPKKETLGDFTSGLLEGLKVGKVDPKALDECIKTEPKALEEWKKAIKEGEDSMKTHNLKEGDMALVDIFKAVAEMVMEADKNGKPLCAALNNKSLNYDDAKQVLRELMDAKTTVHFGEKSSTFNGHDITKGVTEWYEAAKSEKFFEEGMIMGKTFLEAVKAPKAEDPKPKKQDLGDFVAGLLEGLNVGKLDAKALDECVKSEPEAIKVWEEAVKLGEEAMKLQKPEDADKAIIETFKAVATMYFEKSKSGKPLCDALHAKDLKWDDAKTIYKELVDKKTTIHFGEKTTFDGHDITKGVEEWSAALKKGDYFSEGMIMGKTFVAADKAKKAALKEDPKPTKQDLGDFVSGLLEGLEVGKVDAKALDECVKGEPEAQKVWKAAADAGEKAMKSHDFKEGDLAIIETFKAVGAMYFEKSKAGKPLCEALHAKDLKWDEAKTIFKELLDKKTTIEFGEKTTFDGHDITKGVQDWMAALKKGDLHSEGIVMGKTFVAADKAKKAAVKEDPKPKKQDLGDFVSGLLEGLKVGKLDAKALDECIKQEPKAQEIWKKAAAESEKGKKDPKEGDLAMVDVFKAVAEMAMEKGKDGKPLCAALNDKSLNYEQARIVFKELMDPKTTVHFGEKSMFNGHDISAGVKKWTEAYMKGDLHTEGLEMGETFLLADKAPKVEDKPDPKPKKQDLGDFVSGLLEGLNVGKLDAKALDECVKNEPEALKVWKSAAEAGEKAYKMKDAEAGDLAIVETFKAIGAMYFEKSKSGDALCSALHAKDLKWDDAQKIWGELKNKKTSIDFKKEEFNGQDISKGVKAWSEAMEKGDLHSEGMIMGETFMKADKAAEEAKMNLFLY